MDEMAEKWRSKAHSDLEAARFNLSGGCFDVAAFMAQQAAEKALKGRYIKRFGELTKTHDLVFLANRLSAPPDIINHCRRINPAFIYTRYPDIGENVDLEAKAKEIVPLAEKVILWTEKK